MIWGQIKFIDKTGIYKTVQGPAIYESGRRKRRSGQKRHGNKQGVQLRKSGCIESLCSPPTVRSPRGCSLFCLLSRLSSRGLPLGGVLGARTISYLMPCVAAEEAELKLEAVIPLLRSQLPVFTKLVSVWVLWFGRR